MSLILSVHTKDFGVIASDGRALDKETKGVISDTRSKFVPIWGNLVVAGTGDEEFTHRVFLEASVLALDFPWQGGGKGFELISDLARDRIRAHRKVGGYPSALLLVGEDETGAIRGSAWNTAGLEDEAIRGGIVAQAFGAVDNQTYQRAIDRLGREVEQLCQHSILTPTRLILGMQRVFDAVAADCPGVNNVAFFHVIRGRSQGQGWPGIVDGVAYDVRCHAENAAGSASSYATVTNHTVSGAPLVSGNASYRPLSNPLTATDAGASATVSIAAFTMRVAGSDLSVNSGSIAALSFSTLYYIYYIDSDFNGGSVTYYATTTKENALAGPDRFFVGSILTPADGALDTIGNNDGGSGAQIGHNWAIRPTVFTDSGSNAVVNPERAMDNDEATCADVPNVDGEGNWSVFPSLQIAPITSLTLKIKTEYVPTSGSNLGHLVYTLNRGTTWTDIFSQYTSRGLTTDSITLDIKQAVGNVWVRATVIGSGGVAHLYVYDVRIELVG